MRWQIELIFKDFKSNLQLHIIKGTDPNRVKCLLYGRLISVVVLFIIQQHAVRVTPVDREISHDKLTKRLLTRVFSLKRFTVLSEQAP